MLQTSSRVVLFIEKCYQFISNSFFFWGMVIRHLIVYGWSSAMRRTLLRRNMQTDQQVAESSKRGHPFDSILSTMLTE